MSPRSIIEVRYVEFQPYSAKLATPVTTPRPITPISKVQQRRGFQGPTMDLPSSTMDFLREDVESHKANSTTQEDILSVKHLFTGMVFCKEESTVFKGD